MSNTEALNLLNSSISLIERYAEIVQKDSKSEEELSRLKNLAPHIVHYCNAIEIRESRELIFEEIVKQIDSASEQLDEQSVLNEFEERIDCIAITTPQKCERYMKFLESLLPADKDEDEIATVYQTISNVDPITKLPIEEPVKNLVCGHIYEKKTIFQFLEKNSKVKCPIAGCNTSEFIKKSDLVADPGLKRLLSNAAVDSPQKKIKVNK